MTSYEVHVCDFCGHEEKGRESQYARLSIQNMFGEKAKEALGKPSVYGDICPMCEDVIRNTLKKLKEKKSLAEQINDNKIEREWNRLRQAEHKGNES
jgi:hypothetical protein